MTEAAPDVTSLRAAEGILGQAIVTTEPLRAGANNRLFRAETEDHRYMLKLYPPPGDDGRNGFSAETRALAFMQDFPELPAPALRGYDREAGLAVMDFVEGQPADKAGTADIDAAVSFAMALRRAYDKSGRDIFGPATEACLSPADVFAQISRRRDGLQEAASGSPSLAEFLTRSFDPAFETFSDAAETKLATAGIDKTASLSAGQLTLSPSDFGFHNAIRRADGGLTFVDFEYFGTDDPVRLVADFLLHPGHALDAAQKRKFRDEVGGAFSELDPAYAPRFDALYPLVGLRWCMIILNEFLPRVLARRRAAGVITETRTLQDTQLRKANRLLDDLKLHYEGESS
ncbi:MAG: phosphotransferase [Rhodospirillales bacterium]|nr:phosphotransferase [Rhodospirillales bacterium]MBO6787728.1 phosphotransferase [Rhodospirillales bacterium]